MGESRADFGRGMRWLLLFCGPMNVAGAACFAPPFPVARREFGLSEPAPFYLWVLSAWILAFGVAYFRQGWSGRADRGALALGAWGKGVFAGLLVGQAVAGELPPFAGVAAVPDLGLAVVFAAWLLRSPRGARQAEPGAAADGGAGRPPLSSTVRRQEGTAMAEVSAPFTNDQVASLNAYQAGGVGHPFTCGGSGCREALRATPAGWACVRCGYRQGWAHPFMADWSWHRRADAEPGAAADSRGRASFPE